jgi:hypothetical protein
MRVVEDQGNLIEVCLSFGHLTGCCKDSRDTVTNLQRDKKNVFPSKTLSSWTSGGCMSLRKRSSYPSIVAASPVRATDGVMFGSSSG